MILGFVVLVAVGLAGIVLLLLIRSEVAALREQVIGFQAAVATQAAAPTQPQAAAPTEPQAAAPTEPEITEPMRMQGKTPSGADEFGALLLGNRQGTSVVEVFVDFQCPYCQRWDQQIGDDLINAALIEGSQVLVKVNPLAFLGETTADLSVPGASARAANAAACISEYEEPAVLSRYIAAVYAAADPSEPAGQFPETQLVDIATTAGAGTQTTECIRTSEFMPYVAEVTRNSFVRGVGGTPTVILNGSVIPDPFASSELQALATAPS
jgi:protein-disulfide isomerase